MAQALLSRLRRNLSTRRTWLLDITTDIAVPCVAAVSCRADGFGVAFGLAARPTLAAAARSAILEMCQIELAYAVIEAKCRERGEAAPPPRSNSNRYFATVQPSSIWPSTLDFGTRTSSKNTWFWIFSPDVITSGRI